MPAVVRARAPRWLVPRLCLGVFAGVVVVCVIHFADQHERQSAWRAHSRVLWYILQLHQTEVEDRQAGLPLHARAAHLFVSFGGVFHGWISHFLENRRHELALLQSPGGAQLALSAMLALCGVALSSWLALHSHQWVQFRLTRYAIRNRNPQRLIDIPLQGGLPACQTLPSGFANRVCNTRVLWFPLPFKPWRVCVLKFLASLILYFGSPDDFFFLFVAFGQVIETGSFRSCGPVLFFCALFCSIEAMAALRQARQDTELNQRLCSVVRGGTLERLPWAQVELGCHIRLLSGETPPCDLLISHVHGSLRAREKELTGESKPVVKSNLIEGLSSGHVRVLPGEDELVLASDSRRLDSSGQLFRGTTVVLSPTGESAPFVDGIAVRLGHQCRMHRECAVASQRPSLHLQRMSNYGMVLVGVLLFLCYDNALSIFNTGNSHGRSFSKVFFGLLIYENTLVPMSLKQVTMVVCAMQAAWYSSSGAIANGWQAVTRLGELATATTSFILTDKTGTLTLNRMVTQVVARRIEPHGSCKRWAMLSGRPATIPLADGPHGNGSISLAAPQSFPSAVLPAESCDELHAAARQVYHSWVATTGELPGGEVGEAEEASFLEKLPGRLLANVNDGKGGGRLSYALSRADGQEVHSVQVKQQLPLTTSLRAKGAVVAAAILENARPTLSSASWSSMQTLVSRGSECTSGGGDEGREYTLIMQGAGSFFARMNAENAEVVDFFEGREVPGLMLRHWTWRGSLRIWFHGERRVTHAELERYVESVQAAQSEGERVHAMETLARGLVVTQANAMEDPYQDEVPECIAALRHEGYRIMMVTGDSEAAAENIAFATGLAVRPTAARPQPLVHVPAESMEELLELVRTLQPAAELGTHSFCFLFDATTTGVLQRAAESVLEAERSESHNLLYRLLRYTRRLRRCCHVDTAETAEREGALRTARQLVEAVVALLQSGAHSAVWAQVSVEQKPFIAWFIEQHVGVSTLAIGDGVNDVGMIRTAHVSVGIRGTESDLAAQAACFRAAEWRQLRPLLLRHAVRSMVLLSSVMKWIYYKHAMTACALEAWMVHNGYTSWLDPTDPIYAALFNLAVFTTVTAYAVEDRVVKPEVVRRKNLFSISSLLRWWATGVLHGFIITFAIVLCFENQTPREAGVRILCIQAVVLAVRLAFITNHWVPWGDVWDDKPHHREKGSASAASYGDIEMQPLIKSNTAPDVPVEVDDRSSLEILFSRTLRVLHSKGGHFLPTIIYVVGCTSWTGVDTIPLMAVATVVSAICLVMDCLIFPRYGPLRYMFEMLLHFPSRVLPRRKDSKVKTRRD